MTWPTVALSEVCEINVGRTPSRSEPAYWGPSTPWLSIADMNQGRDLVRTKETITDLAVKGAAAKLVVPGTVLLSFKLSIGKVGIARRPMFTNEAIAALPIRDPSILLSDYLCWALKSMDLTGGANRAAMGATLNKAKLRQVMIPLPSMDEQRRIAAILDQADGLRVKRREALSFLDDLTQSIFLDTFGDPLGSDVDARAVPLSSLVERVTYGFTSPMTHVESGIPIITAKNVTGGTIDFEDCQYGTKSEFDGLTDKSKPRQGDILVTKDGSIGRCAVVPRVSDFCINQSVAVLRPRLDRVHPRWLMGFLTTDRVQTVMSGMSKGNALKHLQITELAGLPIVHAGKAEQTKYVERVSGVEALGESGRAQSADFDRLFASLQSRAFAGEL